jgi:D-3-phosphoglycerate dehydrogenase
MSKKVLIIDEVHELLINGLALRGFEVLYQPKASRNDLLHLIVDADGLVVRTKTQIDREVLELANKLSFIGRAGAGLDNVDLKFALQKGIQVFNAGEANADAVGEHTIGMMLSLFAKINKADKEVRQGVWDRKGNTGLELSGKTIAIIGFGNTGKAVAQKLSGFNVNILAYDKYLTGYGKNLAKEVAMEVIYQEADVVTFHVPLTDETKQLVNMDFMNQFSKPIWLLNLSRGQVIKTEDLIKGIECGKILGAGLDVLENEQLDLLTTQQKDEFNYLINSNRTVLSPHVGGWTNESYYKISEVLLKKIDDLNLNLSVT